MRIELDAALRFLDGTIASFDSRSAYLKVDGFYINVFTVIRGSRMSVEESIKKHDAIRQAWHKFATGNFVIEFHSMACDSEGQRQMKLMLAELEDREATDRLRTEDIDEFDFEAREAVGKLFKTYERLVLDSDFQWPGAEDSAFVAAKVPFKPMPGHPELLTLASLPLKSSEMREAFMRALEIKSGNSTLALGAYLGLPVTGL